MATQYELAAMRRAIALSAFGLGTTSPNPPVGCVVLGEDGRLVGQGFHRRKGGQHAEALALAQAGEKARKGTAVVTLEPCNHYGRTPPCHRALIDAGIRRVLTALTDPTSRGEGGVTLLRRAGLEVEVNVLAHEALLVLGPWLEALEFERPHVRWVCLLDDMPSLDALAVVPDASSLKAVHDVIVNADGSVGL
jgi:diaminohydroxyphosphoribosylaminopyrimidine deaminase/5-amino-6-(5-phosphoribosylamino)uracil reductase